MYDATVKLNFEQNIECNRQEKRIARKKIGKNESKIDLSLALVEREM